MICETPSYKGQVQESLPYCVTHNNTSPRTLPGITLFNSVQSLSHIQLFVIPWTAAHQVSLSITKSQNLLKLTSIETVMPSNYLILCHPLLLLPSNFPSIRVFPCESVPVSHQVAKVLELQLQHQSFQ